MTIIKNAINPKLKKSSNILHPSQGNAKRESPCDGKEQQLFFGTLKKKKKFFFFLQLCGRYQLTIIPRAPNYEDDNTVTDIN